MSDQKPVEQTPVAEAVKPAEAVDTTDNDAAVKAEEPAKDSVATATPESEAAQPEEQNPEKPPYLTDIPNLEHFFDHLSIIIDKAGHSEMWGVPLKDREDVPTVNVLIKFLRANEGNLQAAEDQLTKALEWRKEAKPLELVESGRYSASKYGGLGYLTTYEQDGCPLVFTWNIYGAVKDVNVTFADSDEFVKWRATLMEMAVQDLKMKDATTVIDYAGEKDPYQMIQVHDYLNVKFFRMDPSVRAATKKTIDVLSTVYPELLREKFFVNVPAIMGWMFTAMKMILSRNTTRKFHPITNGVNLAREFPACVADRIPKTYGGKGPELKDESQTVQLVEDKDEKKEDKKEETKTAEAAGESTIQEAPAKAEPSQEASKEDVVKEEPAKEESK